MARALGGAFWLQSSEPPPGVPSAESSSLSYPISLSSPPMGSGELADVVRYCRPDGAPVTAGWRGPCAASGGGGGRCAARRFGPARGDAMGYESRTEEQQQWGLTDEEHKAVVRHR